MMLYIKNASYTQGMEYLEMVMEVLNNDNDSFLRTSESISLRKREVRECKNYLLNKFKKKEEETYVEEEEVSMRDKIIIDPNQGNEETSESIPKSKRKFLNPSNGKLVGYQRARKLGLV